MSSSNENNAFPSPPFPTWEQERSIIAELKENVRHANTKLSRLHNNEFNEFIAAMSGSVSEEAIRFLRMEKKSKVFLDQLNSLSPFILFYQNGNGIQFKRRDFGFDDWFIGNMNQHDKEKYNSRGCAILDNTKLNQHRDLTGLWSRIELKDKIAEEMVQINLRQSMISHLHLFRTANLETVRKNIENSDKNDKMNEDCVKMLKEGLIWEQVVEKLKKEKNTLLAARKQGNPVVTPQKAEIVEDGNVEEPAKKSMRLETVKEDGPTRKGLILEQVVEKLKEKKKTLAAAKNQRTPVVTSQGQKKEIVEDGDVEEPANKIMRLETVEEDGPTRADEENNTRMVFEREQQNLTNRRNAILAHQENNDWQNLLNFVKSNLIYRNKKNIEYIENLKRTRLPRLQEEHEERMKKLEMEVEQLTKMVEEKEAEQKAAYPYHH